jgi:hypothetical protein
VLGRGTEQTHHLEHLLRRRADIHTVGMARAQ